MPTRLTLTVIIVSIIITTTYEVDMDPTQAFADVQAAIEAKRATQAAEKDAAAALAAAQAADDKAKADNAEASALYDTRKQALIAALDAAFGVIVNPAA